MLPAREEMQRVRSWRRGGGRGAQGWERLEACRDALDRHSFQAPDDHGALAQVRAVEVERKAASQRILENRWTWRGLEAAGTEKRKNKG